MAHISAIFKPYFYICSLLLSTYSWKRLCYDSRLVSYLDFVIQTQQRDGGFLAASASGLLRMKNVTCLVSLSFSEANGNSSVDLFCTTELRN